MAEESETPVQAILQACTLEGLAVVQDASATWTEQGARPVQFSERDMELIQMGIVAGVTATFSYAQRHGLLNVAP